MNKSIIVLIVLLSSNVYILSQDKKKYEGEIPVPVKIDAHNKLKQQNQPAPSKEIIDFVFLKSKLNYFRFSASFNLFISHFFIVTVLVSSLSSSFKSNK